MRLKCWASTTMSSNRLRRFLGFLRRNGVGIPLFHVFSCTDLSSQDTRVTEDPTPFTIHLLVSFGFVAGILAHVGYDTWDSLNWISKLPPPALRLVGLLLLALLCGWLWEMGKYWFSFSFREICFLTIVTVSILVWTRYRSRIGSRILNSKS